MTKVTFNTDKLNQFKKATNRTDLKAYQNEILSIINEVGVIVLKGFKVVTVQFPSLKVNIPFDYLTTLK